MPMQESVKVKKHDKDGKEAIGHRATDLNSMTPGLKVPEKHNKKKEKKEKKKRPALAGNDDIMIDSSRSPSPRSSPRYSPTSPASEIVARLEDEDEEPGERGASPLRARVLFDPTAAAAASLSAEQQAAWQHAHEVDVSAQHFSISTPSGALSLENISNGLQSMTGTMNTLVSESAANGHMLTQLTGVTHQNSNDISALVGLSRDNASQISTIIAGISEVREQTVFNSTAIDEVRTQVRTMNDRIFALEHVAPSAPCSSPKTQSTPGSLPASAAWPALAKDAAKDASRPPRAPPTGFPGPASGRNVVMLVFSEPPN